MWTHCYQSYYTISSCVMLMFNTLPMASSYLTASGWHQSLTHKSRLIPVHYHQWDSHNSMAATVSMFCTPCGQFLITALCYVPVKVLQVVVQRWSFWLWNQTVATDAKHINSNRHNCEYLLKCVTHQHTGSLAVYKYFIYNHMMFIEEKFHYNMCTCSVSYTHLTLPTKRIV